ncbi:MAG: GntR family transcriptional regulator [Acidimicrobiaceae bacterium]|nr:GntR family transcriptional regulator [Acidimicrobiaceae bacterium]MYF33458.1 GntR family transcriptional regulator [Acidimicrobiaceae bacterium]
MHLTELGGQFRVGPSRLAPLSRKNLSEQIIDAIRNAIVEGRFRPGDKIPEAELAEQLGVSRTPVREAFKLLEQQGLIEIRSKHGTYVASMNRAEAEDGLHVRAALEVLAVRQALDRLSPQEWDELCGRYEAMLQDAWRASDTADAVTGIEFDIAWHTLLVESAGNQALLRTWSMAGLSNLIWSFEFELYPLDDVAFKSWVLRHVEFLDVLRSRDPDACEEAVRSHILIKVDDVDDVDG